MDAPTEEGAWLDTEGARLTDRVCGAVSAESGSVCVAKDRLGETDLSRGGVYGGVCGGVVTGLVMGLIVVVARVCCCTGDWCMAAALNEGAWGGCERRKGLGA